MNTSRLTAIDFDFIARSIIRHEATMTDEETEQIKQRLELLTKSAYPFGEEFRTTFKEAVGDAVPFELSAPDPFADHPHKDKIDVPLAKWVSGEINDDIALSQLLPMAAHYEYADTEEDDRDDLTPKQHANFPFAAMVMNAWDAVLGQAPDDLHESYSKELDDIGWQRDLGMSEQDFLKRLKGRHSCHSRGDR